MNIEEMINSDDIEVATLGANLYFQREGRDALIELLEKSKKYVFTHIYKDVVHLRRFYLRDHNPVFIKDPTRTTLIDIK